MDQEVSNQRRFYIGFTLVIQAALAIGLVLFVLRRDWENVFLTLVVIGLTLVPAFLQTRDNARNLPYHAASAPVNNILLQRQRRSYVLQSARSMPRSRSSSSNSSS